MDELEKLNEEVIELRFQLRDSKDKEMIYLDILNTLQESLIDLFDREEENNSFLDMDDPIDYRECLVNLKKNLDEYKRVYKISF